MTCGELIMLQYDPKIYLPSAEELPDSDDTPVDNELQELIPNLLKAVLAMAWAERMDWFFGVDMGVYYDPEKAAIVPDGFLSLGVKRFVREELRLSYVIWEERQIPILVLEVVSKTYGREYKTKKEKYAELGVLYYAVYNPRRRRKPTLEVHRLVNGVYVLQLANPVWLPEVGLGIGRERGMYHGMTREWLYWYDEQGQRLLTAEELTQEERQRRQEAEQRAQEAERRAQMLEERLRALGINPDSLA